MAGNKAFTAALDLTTGALSQDIGKVVNTLVNLVLAVRRNKLKCEELVGHVQSVDAAIRRIDRSKAAFTEDDYKVSLRKFLIVVQDCKACVERYTKKGFLVRCFLSLNFEEEFDSLNARLENAVKWFGFGMQVHQIALLHHHGEAVEVVKIQFKGLLDEVRALSDGRLNPDDTQLSNVEVGDSLIEGYILAGRLDDSLDVMLVATENEKKQASILKRISDNDGIGSDNILRFHGTFSHGPHKYLVMERPGQTLRTVYDWIREDHGDDWRLKKTMALETALGLACAHVAGVLHRNLRSANVFLSDDGHPRIFGFFKGRVKNHPSDKKWTDAEQLRWAAPEMLDRNRPQYNEKCDIFSLGVIIWELITSGSPFSEFPNVRLLVRGRLASKTKLHFQGFESDVPFLVAFKQVSLDCMEDDPEKRPTIDSIVSRLELLAPEDTCVPLAGESSCATLV